MELLSETLIKKNILVDELTAQIKKDLQLSGIDDDIFKNIITADALVLQLQHFVTDLLSYQPENFNRFMYRIDVSEKDLSHLNFMQLTDLAEHISRLILNREMQKIIFRKQFG